MNKKTPANGDTTKESSHCANGECCHSRGRFWFWVSIRIVIVVFIIIEAFLYGMTIGFEKFSRSLDFGNPYGRGYLMNNHGMMRDNRFQGINNGQYLPPQPQNTSSGTVILSGATNTGSIQTLTGNTSSGTVQVLTGKTFAKKKTR